MQKYKDRAEVWMDTWKEERKDGMKDRKKSLKSTRWNNSEMA
jgi:hypothetical protein